MYKHPTNVQVGDTVSICESVSGWNSLTPCKVTFAKVTKVSELKITLNNGAIFSTRTWKYWGEKVADSPLNAGTELYDESTGIYLLKRIKEEVTCQLLAQDAIESIEKVNDSRFRQHATGWGRDLLKLAVENRKKAMLDAVAKFDRVISSLEAM